MTSAAQLLIFGACSLAMANSIFASARETSSKSSSVSYSPAKTSQSKNQFQSNFEASKLSAQDLSPAASNSIPIQTNGYPQQQPSIYHSIIDRAASSSQPASPVQATTSNTSGDLHTAAGHHHGHAHGKYYEYREVPKKKTWKFGYKRGNHKHTISRHEHGKAGKHPHFKTKVKWHDKKSKGKGIHLWDYNHHDKKHYHHG